MNTRADITPTAATARVFRHVAMEFRPSVFARTPANDVSAALFGDFAFPNLLPVDEPAAELPMIEAAASAWEDLADLTDGGTTTFPEIHSLLFFLEVLGVGRKLLYRGQSDAAWGLQTTLTRWLDQGWDIAAIRNAKAAFIDVVHALPDRRHLQLLPDEAEALCQHYGFPTAFLDFTWSLDIAAFFALGGVAAYEGGRPAHAESETGSLWVVDAMGAHDDGILIVSLGRGFLRPALQRGEFLRTESNAENRITKLTFRHSKGLWADGLHALDPDSCPSLAAYLMPARDPVDDASVPILAQLQDQNRRNR